MQPRLLVLRRQFPASCRYLHLLPELVRAARKQLQAQPAKFQERCMRNLGYPRILELNPISISFYFPIYLSLYIFIRFINFALIDNGREFTHTLGLIGKSEQGKSG